MHTHRYTHRLADINQSMWRASWPVYFSNLRFLIIIFWLKFMICIIFTFCNQVQSCKLSIIVQKCVLRMPKWIWFHVDFSWDCFCLINNATSCAHLFSRRTDSPWQGCTPRNTSHLLHSAAAISHHSLQWCTVTVQLQHTVAYCFNKTAPMCNK